MRWFQKGIEVKGDSLSAIMLETNMSRGVGYTPVESLRCLIFPEYDDFFPDKDAYLQDRVRILKESNEHNTARKIAEELGITYQKVGKLMKNI